MFRMGKLKKTVLKSRKMPMLRSLGPIAVAVALGCAACTSVVKKAEEAKREVLPSADPRGASELPPVSFGAHQLPDFVDFAMTNRPEMAAAAIEVELKVRALEIVDSGAPFMPHLTADARYGQSTANGPHFSWKNSGRFSGGVNLEMLLLDFGRYDAEQKAACEELAAAELAFEEKRLTVFGEVSAAYFRLVLNDALLDAARTNEWESAQHLAQASNRFEHGEAKILDVLRARLDLSKAVQSVIAASNATVTAGAEFIRALGLSGDRACRQDVLPAAFDGLGSAVKVFAPTASDASELYAHARTNSPAMRVKRAMLRAAMSDVDWTVADLYPELRLSTGFEYADPAWNWSWAFGAAQSLFLGWRKTAAVDAAVARMRLAMTDVDAAERELSRQLAVAVAARDDSAASLAAADVSVGQSLENLRVVGEQYRLGEASRVDYTTAVSAYVTALSERARAFYEGQMAETEIFRLTGESPLYHHRKVRMGGNERR